MQSRLFYFCHVSRRFLLNFYFWNICRMLEHGQPDECEQIRSLLVPSAVDTLKRQQFSGAKILVEKLLS